MDVQLASILSGNKSGFTVFRVFFVPFGVPEQESTECRMGEYFRDWTQRLFSQFGVAWKYTDRL
jgi:hypothetical protein